MNRSRAKTEVGLSSDGSAAHVRQAEDSRRAALNLMEDAVQARQAVEKLNKELRETEERLKFTLDSANAGDWDLDLLTGQAQCSFRHDQCFGATEPIPDWSYEKFLTYVHPDDRANEDRKFRAAVASGQDWNINCRVVWPDESVHWIESSGMNYRYVDGKPTRMLGMVRDVTEQREMENRIKQQAGQLADESRRKDEFLAMLSHELRNPLAPIRSAVHLLRMQERGSENRIQQQAREIIERQVGNLTKLVSDLLEVSRVVSGRIRLDQQTVDLNQVVQHATETVKPLIEQRRHELVLNLGDEPIWVSADPTRMEEVFINLLNNAAKYTDEGGRIEVHCEHAPAGANYAQVRVCDNGMGIDKEILPRIFDLFAQADRSLARSGGGLGIGLSLAQRLVDLHGGTLEVHSPPQDRPSGAGSEFIVKLPLTHAPEVPHPVGSGDETAPHGDGTRVLVVDDNVDQVTMLASNLRHLGYSVQSAHSGPDGLQVALQWRPDIVLLDIGLPDLDGYEVARRLRADSHTKTARLIALTGYARDTDIARSREAGFDAHLAKPVDFGELEKLMPSPDRQRET